MMNPRQYCQVWSIVLLLLSGMLAPLTPAAWGQNVVINEIMYHPPSHNPLEEYLEIFNAGATNVDLSGWKFTKGIKFTFPSNTVLSAANYLVIAGNRQAFTNKYPMVTNYVAGFVVMRVSNILSSVYTNFENSLSNTRETLQLEDAGGNVVDSLSYADEGEWATRQRGVIDAGYQGWTWFNPADGFGKSLELVNRNLPNQHGQNWAASLPVNGTPGSANSVASANAAPLVLEVAHSPVIPQPADPVAISARILDEAANPAVRLFWRVNDGAPPAFTSAAMFDDGAHGDGTAGDGIYGALIPPQANATIVEYYVEAVDASNKTNSWPRPAVDTDGVTSLGHAANALYQVDATAYTGSAPLYKLILTPSEYNELGNMLAGAPNSDAAFNLTFISLDGQGTEVRYLNSVRNRGHGSRNGNPHNYRIGFNSDAPWKGKTALNMNARTTYAQHFGSVLALQSGVAGADSHAAQLRINAGAGPGGTPTYGHYAANEDIGSEWAQNHFPNDGGGNAYKVVRDIQPPNFDYRGAAAGPYTTTYFKQSNASENDYGDMATMLEVMGENQTNLYTTTRARAVANVDQWLLHLALMSLFGNSESGLTTGNNDDYFMYRGVNDPRFILVYHDLDSILGQGSLGTTEDIFRATCCPVSGDSEGSWRAMNWFMHQPDIESLYYRTLQRLLDTTLAKPNYDALITQTLSFYVPVGTINSMKTWMDGRRAYVQGLLNNYFAANPPPPTATLSGEPRSPTPFTMATLTVGGSNVVSYRYKLNNGVYGAETAVASPITLAGLANGSTNVVSVIGKSAAGVWQDETNSPTVSKVWVVNAAMPTVRLNEVLAQNVSAVNHAGTFPDVIELFNEGGASVDVGGLRLTDDAANPNKFTFPANTVITAGGYLVVYANNDDGSGGLHTGFTLSASGEGVYLFHATSNTVLDSVVFGLQLADLSVGRLGGSGDWKLCQPTFPGANTARATGDARSLRINEWLTSGTPPFAEDFVELYNPTSLPVDFGNCSFTDEPIGAPTLSRVPPLTFIQSNTFLKLTADGNKSAGADHLDFSLSSDQGEIALLDPLLSTIDSVSYGPQSPNVAMGRCPDGANNFVFLAAPSPGAGNLCPVSGGLGAYSILPYSAVWQFNQSSNLDGVPNWKDSSFDDAGWAGGAGIFGNTSLSGATVNTVITNVVATCYFRTRFVLPPNVSFASFLLSHYVDDGAVVYINGREAYRYNMNPGAVTYSTSAALNLGGQPGEIQVSNFPLTNAFVGTNLMAVELHPRPSPIAAGDAFMGMKIDAVTNNAAAAGLVINEIFANNSSVAEPDGSTPDWVEFYNPSASAADLGNSSLTDDVALPRKWVFPGGSIIPGRGYYRVFFTSSAPVSGTNTGFGLKDTGDSIYFFAGSGGLIDTLTFGLQAANYSIGRYPAGGTNWLLTFPTPGSSNLVANLGDVAQVKVNEWMANPAAGDDWFELFNANSQPVAIGDHWLTDNLGTPATRQTYQIPKLSFLGIDAYAYRKFDADNNPQNGANHVNFKLANGGESLGFSHPNGTLLDGVTFGAQALDVSQGRLPDGGPNITSFSLSQSPGDLNWLPLPNVVINEVLTHTDPPLEDAIEILNTNAASVNITGWFLSDSKNNLKRYQITNAITIPPGGFRVFYETQFNDTSVPFSAFSLSSAHGDEVYLSAATNGVLTGYRAQVKFGAAENGVSFGRYRTSVGGYDFVAMSARTFGSDNPATVAQFRTGTGLPNVYPKVGPVVFSEIMYHPPALGTNDNTRDEFVELKNITGGAVNLFDPAYPTNRWKIRGGVDFDFPANTVLGASATLLVVGFDPATNAIDLAAFKSVYGISNNVLILGPWSGKLDNGGESLELFKPDAPQSPPSADAGFVPFVLVEQLTYSDTVPWTTNADGTGFSLQRVSASGYGNDPTNWIAALPTASPVGSGDSDSDGMPDIWELAHGFDPGNPADAGLDADADGMTNLQEYLAGTDPLDAASRLWLQSLPPAGNLWVLRFSAIADKSYTLQSRPSLTTGTWQQLQVFPALPTNRVQSITNVLSAPSRFYRLSTP